MTTSWPLARASIIGGLATASGIALTATSGWLIVSASFHPVILTLLTAIVAVRAFGMARPALRYLERLRSHDAALAELARRRTATYRALIPLTPARLGRRSRSDVLTGVVQDLDDEIDAQVRVIVPGISTALAGLVATGVVFWLEPIVGVVLLADLLLTLLLCLWGRRATDTVQADVLSARAAVARTSALVTTGADELRAVGGEDDALRWLDGAHDRLARHTTAVGRVRAIATGSAYMLTGLTTTVVALEVAGPVRHGTLPAAVAALLMLTPLALGDALAALPEAVGAWSRSRAASSRLSDLLALEPAVRDDGASGTERPAGMPPRLTLRALTASWDVPGSQPPQLGPVDLDIAPGEHLALVGANGSGKSTLLAVLARALDPASGDYLLDDVPAGDASLDATRRLFAVLDDEPHLFATSVRENLRIADPGADDRAVSRALLGAGLQGWTDALPHGLDTRLGAGGAGVSGGERARLGLARALLSGRPVLLLDEPVAHLDHATAIAVIDDLLLATVDRTVVMVSHRADGLERFDRVVDLARTVREGQRVGS